MTRRTTTRKTTRARPARTAAQRQEQDEQRDVNKMTDDELAVYDEARKSGATHHDALDAAVGATDLKKRTTVRRARRSGVRAQQVTESPPTMTTNACLTCGGHIYNRDDDTYSSHAPDCEWKARSVAYNDDLRARLSRARDLADTLRAERTREHDERRTRDGGTPRKERTVMNAKDRCPGSETPAKSPRQSSGNPDTLVAVCADCGRSIPLKRDHTLRPHKPGKTTQTRTTSRTKTTATKTTATKTPAKSQTKTKTTTRKPAVVKKTTKTAAPKRDVTPRFKKSTPKTKTPAKRTSRKS